MGRVTSTPQNGKTVNIDPTGDVDMRAATGSEASALQDGLIKQTCDALWMPDDLSKEEIWARIKQTLAALEGIKPEDEIEGMLAAQMVGTHSAAMECLRRAMLPSQTFVAREQNLKHAEKLLALYARQVEVLDKRRGKGQQKVTVEHVHVEAGGQAIVGNVESGEPGRRGRRKTQSSKIEHAPEVPLETPAPDSEPAKQKK